MGSGFNHLSPQRNRPLLLLTLGWANRKKTLERRAIFCADADAWKRQNNWIEQLYFSNNTLFATK